MFKSRVYVLSHCEPLHTPLLAEQIAMSQKHKVLRVIIEQAVIHFNKSPDKAR